MYSGIPNPGEVIGGKYRIERVLGAGGMGVVLSATHVNLQERVALKVMAPELAASKEAVARFVREARAACRIKSEHVARVTDVGNLDSGVPYLVMEYLEGRDLSQVLSERGRLPSLEVVECILQACEALGEAHLLGIVHRDLKPANLFSTNRLDGSVCIKVLDFGVSKVTRTVASPSSFGQTHGAAVMGSPLYMSPEQLRAARSVDRRSDIWSLGVIAYELIAGKPPFNGETLPELSVKIAVDRPESLRVGRRDVPAGIESAILKCLEKDARKRFQDVGELAAALAPFGPEGASASAARIRRLLSSEKRAPESPPGPRTSTVTAVWSPFATSRHWRRSGAGVLILVAAIGIAVAVARQRASHPSVTGPRGAPSISPVQPDSEPSSPVAVSKEASQAVPVVEPTSLELLPPSNWANEPAASSSARPSPLPQPSMPDRPIALAAAAPATSAQQASAGPLVRLIADLPSNVVVDGRPLGMTPLKIALSPGTHTARFYRGSASVTREFAVIPGQESVVSVSARDFDVPNPYRWGSGLEAATPNQSSGAGFPPFDRSEAMAVLDKTAARFSTCAGLGDYGEAVARVAFASSGTVEEVSLSGELAATPAGACIERLLRNAKVRPFSGRSPTLAKRFQLTAPHE